MEEKYGKNMSVMGYYVKNMFRYWRKTFKMMFFYGRSEWSEISVTELFECYNSDSPPLIIDVRTPKEYADGHIPNAILIPVMKLKENFEVLEPFKEKAIVTVCPGGGLSLVAVDILVEGGFADVKSLKGGMDKWTESGYPTMTLKDSETTLEYDESEVHKYEFLDVRFSGEIHHTEDARGLKCPEPILNSRKSIKNLEIGQVMEILTTDQGSQHDIPAWIHVSGNELLLSEDLGSDGFRFLVRKTK